MNLVYGELVDIRIENGMQVGQVRVSGALQKVPLDLVEGAECGDTILMCDGVAIVKVHDSQIDSRIKNYQKYVSGHSR